MLVGWAVAHLQAMCVERIGHVLHLLAGRAVAANHSADSSQDRITQWQIACTLQFRNGKTSQLVLKLRQQNTHHHVYWDLYDSHDNEMARVWKVSTRLLVMVHLHPWTRHLNIVCVRELWQVTATWMSWCLWPHLCLLWLLVNSTKVRAWFQVHD